MNDTPKLDEIGCLEAIEYVYAWLDGELGDKDIAGEVEHHISHCKSCFSRAEMEKALTEHIRLSSASAESAGGNTAPQSLQTRLDKLLNKL